MRVQLSNHAVDRFSERVRPTLMRSAAERELRDLVGQGELRAELDWKNEREGRTTDAFLLLADGIALVLAHAGDHWVATSCVCRAEPSPERKAERRLRRRRRQQKRAYHQQIGKSRSSDWWREQFGEVA